MLGVPLCLLAALFSLKQSISHVGSFLSSLSSMRTEEAFTERALTPTEPEPTKGKADHPTEKTVPTNMPTHKPTPRPTHAPTDKPVGDPTDIHILPKSQSLIDSSQQHHHHAIPNILIFTHYVNLLNTTNRPGRVTNRERNGLRAFQKNVHRSIALHPNATVRFLTDEDCVACLQRVVGKDSPLIDFFKSERKGMYKADLCRGKKETMHEKMGARGGLLSSNTLSGTFYHQVLPCLKQEEFTLMSTLMFA
jgi:hypothetical protein